MREKDRKIDRQIVRKREERSFTRIRNNLQCIKIMFNQFRATSKEVSD